MAAELIPYRPEHEAELRSAAAADEHRVVAPTHTVMKDGEIIGYASINGLPTLHWWLDRTKGKARDSLMLNRQMDLLMLEAGHPYYVAAVGKCSPYVPHLPKLGFHKWMDTGLYVRDIEEHLTGTGPTTGKIHYQSEGKELTA
jgi:hypothetical protein